MKLKMLVSMAGADFALSVNEETERFSGDEAKGLKPGEVPAILQRGEIVLPKNTKMAAGGSETITINLQADRGLIADVADQRIRTASGTIVHVAVTQATERVVPTMASYQRDRAGGDYRG